MSFIDCINQNPALRDKQKAELTKEYQSLVDRYSETMGDTQAAEMAAKKYVDIKQSIIVKKQTNTIRDILAWETNIKPKLDKMAADIDKQKALAGKGAFLWSKSSMAVAARSMIEKVYTRQQAIDRRSTLAIGDQIEKYRSKKAGLTQDTEGFIEVTRSLLGEKVNNPNATADGLAIRKVFDLLHKQYEQAGGILGKLENYYPQTHNPEAVSKAGFENWKNTISKFLDREKMVSPITGLPYDDRSLLDAMKVAYEGIRTNGLNEVVQKAEAGKQTFGKGGGVALRHSSSRFFHFKDAESFLEYNRQFGYGDAGLFDAMMGHIHGMSRDIALMQELGAKPDSQFARIKMKVQADGAGEQSVKTIEGMYNVVAGRTNFNGKLPTWYKALQNVQNVIRSAFLGAAPVSAMSDSFFAGFTAKMNGVPTTKVMGEYFKLLNPADASDRRVARRIGFIAGASNGASLAQARFADDMGSHGLTSWLASFTNRASGLGVMTDAVRKAPVLATQGFMAEAKALNMSWKELDPNMRQAFERWEMGESEYNDILKSKPYKDIDSEADFIRPEDVALSGYGETARKYEMWLVDMAQDASSEPRLLTRAIITGAIMGDAKHGTTLRASVSSVMMFKSFGITVVLNHLLPALRQVATSRGMSRLSRIAPLLLGTTLLGAAAIQARQVLQGKTTRDTNNPKFWMAAMMQGGGFGIFGDYLFSDASRFGADLGSTLAGPVVGFGNDVYKTFKGNFDRALDENSETKFQADAYQMAKKYIPAVKLWYTRLLLERLMLDQAERMIDPKFDTRMSRIEGKMKRDYGQSFWWDPGEISPK